VPPLHPKSEWISRILSLKWNFLYPFSGGSGPTGFYISFLFIALVWVCSVIFALSYLKIKDIKKRAIFCILILGILYNGVFIEEYLFGKINGSPYKLIKNAKEFIMKDKNIKSVLVYNDNGAYEIKETGKYARRIYAVPQFEESYKELFKNFSGHILYIDIPRIGNNNLYSNYFNSCKIIYQNKDKYINSKILDCTNIK
jgi:predicted small secreted protein